MSSRALILLGWLAIRVASAQPALLAASDNTFIQNAHRDGEHEIAMAKVALERAIDPKVQHFAQELIDDHSQANRELAELAMRKGITLDLNASKTPDTSPKSNGRQFDRDFLTQIVNDHERAVSNFTQEQKTVSDLDLKTFIDKTLPVLQTHLTMAQSLQK